MSLLAPLFFAGALAIGLPILFHLIRRRPKSEVQFSSLMFLDPTPPRLTRRSRLDHLPLLLIRTLALLLLAAAFARPFLRSFSQADSSMAPRRFVLLLDTSASMQRLGLWQQALVHARELLAELKPDDRIAVVTFDRQPKTWLGLEESGRLSVDQRRQSVESLLTEIRPTWFDTNLAAALTFAAEVTVDDIEVSLKVPGDDADELSDPVRQAMLGDANIVLISDMQSGSQLESLQAFTWPERVRVDVRHVVAQGKSNSAAFVVGDQSGSEAADGKPNNQLRVRVINAANSTSTGLSIGWREKAESAISSVPQDKRVSVQVPPGQSRIIRVDRPKEVNAALQLDGDDQDFDNVRYVTMEPAAVQKLVVIGADSEDPRLSGLYYLQRVPLSDASREVAVEKWMPEQISGDLQPKTVPLIVLTQRLETAAATNLQQYLQRGGRVLVVMDDAESAAGLAATVGEITREPVVVSESKVRDYHMLSKIEFSNPLFEPMSDPQFNDFTKVRFWSHRSFSGLSDSWNIVAKFDDGDVAVAERSVGDGKLILLSFGWQPAASQLALSTKFIPFVYGCLGANGDSIDGTSWTLGQPLPVELSPTGKVTTPDGVTVAFSSAEDRDVIDRPGVYVFNDGDVTRRLAINLDESESHTDPLGDEVLETFGVAIGKHATPEQTEATVRQLRDRELEGRQKLWRWLMVVALGLLGLETWWGGRLSRSPAMTSLDNG